MNRRQFLGLSAALAAAPLFIRRAFADESCLPLPGGTEQVATLAGAYRRAQRNGRALLVLVIPTADDQKWARGAALGELLNHGSDEQLAPLASVEVVCAGMAEVRKLIPGAPTGEPLMVVVDTQKMPATARALHTTLPEYGDTFGRGRGGDWQEMIKKEDRIADQRIARLAALIQPIGIPGDAAGVRARLVKQRVPGSYWANASGCGTSVEGDDESMRVACGMGHVPSKSSRFLYLYTQTPSQQWKAQRDKK